MSHIIEDENTRNEEYAPSCIRNLFLTIHSIQIFTEQNECNNDLVNVASVQIIFDIHFTEMVSVCTVSKMRI